MKEYFAKALEQTIAKGTGFVIKCFIPRVIILKVEKQIKEI